MNVHMQLRATTYAVHTECTKELIGNDVVEAHTTTTTYAVFATAVAAVAHAHQKAIELGEFVTVTREPWRPGRVKGLQRVDIEGEMDADALAAAARKLSQGPAAVLRF